MSFLIKSDAACPPFPPEPLVRNRADVLLDFALEALRGGAERVYIVLCDEEVVELAGTPAASARELAGEIQRHKRYRGSLRGIVSGWRGPVYYLHESGVDVSRVRMGRDSLIVVGDHDGLSRGDEEFLRGRALWVSIGPKPYLSWFCAAYMAARLRGILR